MAFQQHRPDDPGEARVERYRQIGSTSGTIIGAVVIFAFLAFGERPHRLGLAVIATVVFLVVAMAFDLFLRTQAKKRKSARGKRF
jgi:Na+/melibiose symporter-like transporter